MPHHREMVRSQRRVVETFGLGVARHVLTLRLSPPAAGSGRLRTFLGEQARKIAARVGTTAAHLLRTETPEVGVTTEQKFRGGRDKAADRIFDACGYDLAALQSLRSGEMSDEELSRRGTEGPVQAGLYAHGLERSGRLRPGGQRHAAGNERWRPASRRRRSRERSSPTSSCGPT